VHPLRDEDALARLADLTGVAEGAERSSLDGQLEIGIVKDDRRTVSAELEQQRLRARLARDSVPDREAAGEADRMCPGI
jgi:hypothetical protein